MPALTIEIPDEIARFWSTEELANLARKWAVLELLRRKKISLQRGGELLGLDDQSMLALAQTYRIAALHLDEQEADSIRQQSQTVHNHQTLTGNVGETESKQQ